MSSFVDNLTIRFWGVRGSVPTPDGNKRRFGGNTPSISVQCGTEPPIILDAGTGLRSWGETCTNEGETSVQGTILFSHFHWDHIQGFPFLPSLYTEECKLRLYSIFNPAVLEAALRGQMQEPYFPIPYSAIRAQLEYRQIEEEGLQIGGVSISPIHLNHPGGCAGYRLRTGAGSLVYATDHEHGLTPVDDRLVRTAEETDLLIYDSHFTPAEYQTHKGWGHSTWREACKIARRAAAKRLLLFHHSPTRTDDQVDALLNEARAEFPWTDAATEDESLVLPISEQPKLAKQP